ncbi:MAG TPA: phosphatase PAP2 family protein, partial [Gemmatimonadales bacterium]|nr:phosphatase PAP2 family protein [Gemmatimonadales bacterium]
QPVALPIALLWLPPLVAAVGHLPGADQPGHTALSIPALMTAGLVPLWVAAGWARLRGRDLNGMVRLLRERGWLGARLVRYLALALTVTAFFGSLAQWKSAIPLFYPGFRWDAPIEAVEVLLHGDHPDRFLAPLFGSPRGILFLDRVYHTWFYMLFGLVVWQAWEADHRRLRQFWLSFALIWVGFGILLATLLASAGPIYAALDRGSASYDDLLARLNAAEALGPLFVRLSAGSLWAAARQPGFTIGDGISAFPSLHVALAWLAALALWRVHRGLGLVGAGYALLILLGSIMLGWHYALDGEAAILGVAVVWAGTGRVAMRGDGWK